MNCSCHCNGKCKLLGGLEQKIMDVIWSSPEPLKPQEVLFKLEGDYAYTTIMTVLKRMADKKILHRQLKGKVYYYSSTTDKQTFACECLADLFDRLFDSYGQELVTSFRLSAQKHKIKI